MLKTSGDSIGAYYSRTVGQNCSFKKLQQQNKNKKEHHGVDWECPVPDIQLQESVTVAVPDTPRPLGERALLQLQEISSIQRVIESSNHGVDIYLEAIDFLSQNLESV